MHAHRTLDGFCHANAVFIVPGQHIYNNRCYALRWLFLEIVRHLLEISALPWCDGHVES